jgi:7-keto-8-aminopelargonate synthetase-like enzyme
MDGDTAPLQQIIDLKERSGAWLLLDEAHALGIMGPGGRGLAAELGLSGQVELHLGTLSKAVGLSGGYLAASRAVVDVLINRARSFIFSTSPPAPVAAASRKAIEIVASMEGDSLRAKLWLNLERLHSLLPINAPASAILPVIIGNETVAVQTSARLLEKGFLVPAIRFPTVAKGSARLRVTLTAEHTASGIDSLAEALQECTG